MNILRRDECENKMKKMEIIKLLPEIKMIKKAVLRDGVIDAWIKAAQKGGWRRINDVPFTLLLDTDRTLIEHTRSVTRMSYLIATERNDLDVDVVLAGALVHDVGKLLEYTKKGKKVIKSEHGRLIRHPVSGYSICLEVGLPLSVAHVVAAHSAEGDKVTRSGEAVVINHCDFIDFDIEKNKK